MNYRVNLAKQMIALTLALSLTTICIVLLGYHSSQLAPLALAEEMNASITASQTFSIFTRAMYTQATKERVSEAYSKPPLSFKTSLIQIPPQRVVYEPGSTRKICQFTGEFDRERNQQTTNRTESRYGLEGTDLGASVEHNGRIYFLFGDTNANPSKQNPSYRISCKSDSVAYTLDTDPEDCLNLQFITAPDGGYLSPKKQVITWEPVANGRTLKERRYLSFMYEFEVPTGGFSVNSKMYAFFTEDHRKDPRCADIDLMGRSFLARWDDEAQNIFTKLYDVSSLDNGGKFINVAPVVANNADIPGLPESTGQGVLLWGNGRFRQSDPYLAWLPLRAGFEDRGGIKMWRYFAGVEAGSLRPIWSEKESEAMPLFSQPCLGEFSVSWNSFLRKWLMLYNCDTRRGINFRAADRPWGPWSPASVLFDPWQDNGYCHFMHVNWDFRVCDLVHDLGRERGKGNWGGEYGPYMIPRFTTSDATSTTIYFVMSTWNPYNTVLMKSKLKLERDQLPVQFTGNPALIQSRFGGKGNFELVVPLVGGDLAHYWRNNDNRQSPWSWPIPFISNAAQVDSAMQIPGQVNAVALIQSNFGPEHGVCPGGSNPDPNYPGNLEVVARMGDRLVFFWRDHGGWHGPYPVIPDGVPVTRISGNPALIQGRHGGKGNFELVVPLASGGLAHYWRDNDPEGAPWKRGQIPFGAPRVRVDAVSLIQSNFSAAGNGPGNLELVARINDRLVFFFRPDVGGPNNQPGPWQGPFDIRTITGDLITGVSGNPALIQSGYGRKGNFELVVPLAAGGLRHYRRNNDVQGEPWDDWTDFGQEVGQVDAVSLIQSNFGRDSNYPGNLEVVARVGGRLVFFWRDRNYNWNGPLDMPMR